VEPQRAKNPNFIWRQKSHQSSEIQEQMHLEEKS
jgi:hypothetical protein